MNVRQITRIGLLIMACAVFGSGCSVKMMYNNLDRFARWSASDYVDMDDTQREYFNAEIDAMLYWHRSQELPRYAEYIGSLEGTLGNGTDPEEIQGLMDTMYGWWDVIEDRALPMLTELLLSMTDEQVADLPANLGDDNEEFAEDESDTPLAEIQETWAKEYADVFSRFSGKLTREQKDYLAAQSIRYVPQLELWADYRRRWQGDFMTLVREGRSDPEQFAESLATLMKARESYYGEELDAVFAINEALAREATAWLINHFTAKQRERFFTRLNELADDFRELSAELPDQVPVGGGCLVRC